MLPLHHIATGNGQPPLVFVHGFGCDHTDWLAQIVHFTPQHRCIAIDLPAHGASPGSAEDCSMERYGGAVAERLRAQAVPPAVLIGHSMGCRVVIEAALQAPECTAAVILVDGSQFAASMGPTLRETFATADGYANLSQAWFESMFTAKSNPDLIAAAQVRTRRLPRSVGETLILDMVRYDTTRLEANLAALTVPVLALQTTFSNERRERQSLTEGQTTPFLDMLRARVGDLHVAIIPNTGHFPQTDEPTRTNQIIGAFVTGLT